MTIPACLFDKMGSYMKMLKPHSTADHAIPEAQLHGHRVGSPEPCKNASTQTRLDLLCGYYIMKITQKCVKQKRPSWVRLTERTTSPATCSRTQTRPTWREVCAVLHTDGASRAVSALVRTRVYNRSVCVPFTHRSSVNSICFTKYHLDTIHSVMTE